ncbi:uncharacterized protein N7477_003317 [Penicillium maclennaniae]|uniref:uncharacterized protein n=1 Tax=Penicillium maclennaniae TaxID=1343394 RepID=UPI00254242FF|nr:uncharacterized protein N7477_003317 [Penicillium maclennaniae]KAJ5677684.1 hypothetical protein N7477_003317 [Penicillium maclennaniae]
MRFTQVAFTATLAAAVIAAPVPNEDVGVNLGGVVIVGKREQAEDDLGVGLGIGASVTKHEPIASALANLARSPGVTVPDLEKAL